MGQHLEDLHNSVSNVFQMMLQSHACINDPFRVQNKPVDFQVREYEKFIDKVSGSTPQSNL